MQAAELARNHWPELLTKFGIEPNFLTGKHTACPFCGGRDRFRFDDKDGRGTFFCSHCGAGDGFALLGLVKGWPFKEAAAEVERIVGSIEPAATKRQTTEADKREACKRIWSESRPVTDGDPVALYLLHRVGIETAPGCIRFHPALPYRHDDGTVTKHPAMLARVQDADGNGCAIHRTYLTTDGSKANVSAPKKIIGSLPPRAAVRLSSPGWHIGIAEGIETALSASVLFELPVWAAISAIGLERWTPPEGITEVIIFGDNDRSATGQAAAWNLAKRLIASGIVVEVRIPEPAGTDWNDLNQGDSNESRTAQNAKDAQPTRATPSATFAH